MAPRPFQRIALPRGFFALALLLTTLLLPRFASAAPPGQRPVIVRGREHEILALFEPHVPGQEITEGWILHSFRIDRASIDVWVAGPADAGAHLRLDHPDYGPADALELTGFDLEIVARDPGSEVAVDALIAAIRANDDGSFWGRNLTYAGEPSEHPPEPKFDAKTAGQWLFDGLVLLGLLSAVLLGLTLHKLRGAPRWVKWSLPAIVLGAAALRVGLSPAVAMAPWPYDRELMSGARIFDGPALALLYPGQVWLSETILHSSLVYAVLAPLAVYVHARYLLDDHRAGLFAALLVAVLPLHLRFSHSDAAFIPSITVSSTVFALIHAATRERSQWLGWSALALAAPLVAMMYAVRPLNLMYFPLLLGTAFVNQGLSTDKPALAKGRAIVGLIVLCAVTFGLGVPRLLADFSAQVSEGLSIQTLLSAIQVMTSPRFNALLNPVFTPPLLTLLAVYGGYALWQRGRKPLFWFVVLWLLGFLVAHAYVVPISMYMQARYHLHLVVPFMLLVVCGAHALLDALARPPDERPSWTHGRERLAQGLLLAYVLASPLIHLHAIRYTGLNQLQEWRFVHSLRDQIPAECTVLEYTGVRTGVRFRRVGTSSTAGVARQRWDVREIPMQAEGEPELPEDIRELLGDPPDCLYWYEGLPCFGNKPAELHIAPACHAVPGYVGLDEVAVERFESNPYDGNLSYGLGEAEQIELRLYRVRAQ